MIESMGSRQQDLLKSLLEYKAGLTVEELARRLGITRTAVRQHLTGLERDRLVEQVGTRPSGGRPEQVYALGEKGRELFPRHYDWFAQLLIESICEETGPERLGDRLERLGRQVAQQLYGHATAQASIDDQTRRLVDHMATLGYGAQVANAEDQTPAIEANNCIFHQLASRYPQVCRFDLGLMSAFTNATVEHQECMVRGGAVCRFGFRRPK